MIDKKHKPSSKRGNLTEEDVEIWAQLTRSIKPLPRSLPRELHKETTGEEKKIKTAPPTSVPSKSEEHLKGSRQSLPLPTQKAEIREVKITSSDLPIFNKHQARKLKRGQLEIEARIDLHGMRQHEAHSALRRFLQKSFAQGKRWVLVITGKGTSSQRSYEEDRAGSFGETQRGVLKRNVPLWLAEDDIRNIVVSYTEAAIEHGGSGALYVHLRRRSRVEA